MSSYTGVPQHLKHLFMSEAGVETTASYLQKVLRDKELPSKFRSPVEQLLRRVQRLDSTLGKYTNEARRQVASEAHHRSASEARHRVASELDLPSKLRWAVLGLHNTVEALQDSVATGGREYRPVLQDARNLSDELETLTEEVLEYISTPHPVDWAVGVLDDLTAGLPEMMRNWTFTPHIAAQNRAKKDVGHGGLDEWFSGHGEGKGKAKGEATWGDWVAISPVKKKVERELADGTVKEKTVQPGDIVGPCGVSDDPNWKDVTKGGKDPLKCMPRQKAHDMPKEDRAELARGKMRAERDEGNRGKEPTRTRTFDKEASDVVAGDNEPTKPKLWEEAKAKAKARYTKWPSAYAVGHALKLYKEDGGGWRKTAARPIRIDRAEVQRVSGLALVEFERVLKDVPDGASFAQVYRRAYYEGSRSFTRFDAVDVRGRPVRVDMYIGFQGIPRGAVVAGVSGDKRDMFILANSLMPKAELLGALRVEMPALVAHEVTHLVDVIPDMGETDPVIKTEEAARNYFNRLPEVRGWMRQIYEEIRDEVHRAQASETNLGRAITDALGRSPGWRDASPYLSPKNRKTMLKGLVTAFEDDATPEAPTARRANINSKLPASGLFEGVRGKGITSNEKVR
jgi:hypothetical protein